MQRTSKAYREQMKKPMRGQQFIQATIGVINQMAQATLNVSTDDAISDWSVSGDMSNKIPNYIYATLENDFSKTDESMYFMPRLSSDRIYKSSVTSDDINGSIKFDFDGNEYSFRGMNIDFGDVYPTEFTINTGHSTYEYTLAKSKFSTDDVFSGAKYIEIIPTKMRYTNNRLRIYSLICGNAVVFKNDDIESYSCTSSCSSITNSIPSMDMNFTIQNYDLTYSIDNSKSPINFLEDGQTIQVMIGQTLDDGTVEWTTETTAYLNSWSANDTTASFTATDFLTRYSEKYYKGLYRPNGITAYDLALDVLDDMGCTEYYLDEYMKHITIKNPVPVVAHTQALQIIANACRCSFTISRAGQIVIQSNFIPDMTSSSQTEAPYSSAESVVEDDDKDWYATGGLNYQQVSLGNDFKFLPRDSSKYSIYTGYTSSEYSKADGTFDTNPTLVIELEASFHCYGMLVKFQSLCPEEFLIHLYFNGTLQETKTITNIDSLNFEVIDEFNTFDKVILEFTKHQPEAQVSIDNISFEDVTDYELTYEEELLDCPTATLQDKLKSITVVQTNYTETSDDSKSLSKSGGYVTASDPTITVNFSTASYDLSVTSLKDGHTATIKEYSNYYAVIEFSNIDSETYVEYQLNGKQYVTTTTNYTQNHNVSGTDYTWSNPLVDNQLLAQDLEEWLAVYYGADADYTISYRGDSRLDVNDNALMELKDLGNVLVKIYQHTLNYSGGLSGTIYARKVNNVYKTWDDVNARYTWGTLYDSGITWSKLKARI